MSRRSLHVGINSYPGAPLQGCIADAQDWQRELVRRGYSAELLVDGFATKRVILERLAELVKGARWGDRLVFTYSGHGTWIPDVDGDEPDRRDEALVSVDMRTISDDELYAVIGGVPRGVRLTIVSDSCHSGSVSRFAGQFDGTHRPVPAGSQALARFIDPAHVYADPPISKPRGLPSRAMLLSGCQDKQVSYDALIGGRYRGAMTAAALETLPAATSMKDWHRRTVAALKFPQTPALTANAYQRRLRPFA